VGNAWDENNEWISVTTGGYYYMFLSCGAAIEKPFTLQLWQIPASGSNKVLISIDHLGTELNQEDEFGHGVVAMLNPGDTVQVVGLLGSTFFSGNVGYQTSFIGFILYAV